MGTIIMSLDLHADNNSDNFVDRQTSRELVQQIYQKYSESGFGILVDGANAYTLAKAAHVINVPQKSSGEYCEDQAVPFYQIVLHGIVPYAGEAINMSSDYNMTALKMIETGSFVHFKWMYEKNKVLKGINSDLYAVSYEEWFDESVNLYEKVKEALSDVCGSRIVLHSMVQDNVYQVQYENGKSIYVNYNDRDVTIGNVLIKAKSYAKEG